MLYRNAGIETTEVATWLTYWGVILGVASTTAAPTAPQSISMLPRSLHAMIVVSSKAHSSAPIIRIVLSMSESSHPHILLNRRSMADILSRISSTRSTCSSATLPPTQNRFRQKNSLGGSSFGNDKSDDDTDVALEVVGISSSFPVFVLAPSSPRFWQSLLQYKEPHHRFMPPFVVQKLQGRGVVLLTCRSINLGRHAEMDSCGGDASTSGDGSWA